MKFPSNARPRQKGHIGLGTLLLLLLIGGAATAYFVSAPYQAKVDREIRSFTQWTPENIQRDEGGYLEWAAGEVQEANERLAAERLRLTSERESLLFRLQELQSNQTMSESSLNELKRLFKAGNFPVALNGFEYTQAELGREILSRHNQLESQRELLVSLQARIKLVKEDLVRLRTAEIEREALAAEIDHARLLTLTASHGNQIQNPSVQLQSIRHMVAALEETSRGRREAASSSQKRDMQKLEAILAE